MIPAWAGIKPYDGAVFAVGEVCFRGAAGNNSPIRGNGSRQLYGRRADMANVLWTIIVILFVLWLIGLIAHIGGSLINILIVIVVIGVIYNLLTGRRAV